MKKIDAKKMLLYMLYLPVNGEECKAIEGSTRIQKMFFIFEKEVWESFKDHNLFEKPAFFAYNFGPYSKDIDDNLRFFRNLGYIEEKVLNYSKPIEASFDEQCNDSDWVFEDNNYDTDVYEADVKEHSYCLTDTGRNYVQQKLQDVFNKDEQESLIQLKSKACSMSLKDIIYYVYHKYEEMTDKSIIKDRVFGNE